MRANVKHDESKPVKDTQLNDDPRLLSANKGSLHVLENRECAHGPTCTDADGANGYAEDSCDVCARCACGRDS